MKKSIPVLLCFLLFSASAWTQNGESTELITQPGAQSVDQTVELLREA